MTVTNNDMPHPVPPVAYLRYKENWFFVIIDQKNDLFAAIHVVSEPGFDRIRFACHLSVQGELFEHGSELPFPRDFGFAPELGDGKLIVHFVEAHEQIDCLFNNDDVDLRISFLKRAPLFDYNDYNDANPGRVTLREINGLGVSHQFVHQQQMMLTRGSVTMKRGKAAGRTFTVDALGFRDHSRGMRCDNLLQNHFWSGLHFPHHVFGAMSVKSLLRPETPVECGYVHDEKGGLRSLRQVQITGNGNGPGNLPATVEFHLTDIHDQPFTIVADIGKRFAHVPLHIEKPGAIPYVYDVVENFAPLTLKETGDTGIGLIEIGWSVSLDKP